MLGAKDEGAGISPVLSAVRIFRPYEVPDRHASAYTWLRFLPIP